MGKFDDILACDLPWEQLSNAKVLVTGGNGLIASDLVETIYYASKAKRLNTQLYVLCRTRAKAEKRFASIMNDECFKLVIQDVVDPLDLNIHFNFIIHAASSAHPNAFNNYPVDVMKANFIGTMNMLDYAKQYADTRVMYVSSSEVYGENFENIDLFKEETEGIVNHARFRACYPESKRASETLALSYQKQYGSDVVIVRPAFIYGGDILEDNTRADVYFLRQAFNHENIVMYSAGEQIRSYCYINDCVSGMLYALLKGETGGIYNIGNKDCVVTLREYAQAIANHGGVKLIIDTSTKPQGVVMLKTTKLILDTTRLESLGWKPQYSLEDGMTDIFMRHGE